MKIWRSQSEEISKVLTAKLACDLLTLKSIGVFLKSRRLHHCMSKGNRVAVWKQCKDEVQIWPRPLTPKSIGVLLRSCATHGWSIITICQKVIELSCKNDAKFKFKILLWPFDYKINKSCGQHMYVVLSLYVKRKWSNCIRMIQSSSPNLTMTFELLIPKSIEGFKHVTPSYMQSILIKVTIM